MDNYLIEPYENIENAPLPEQVDERFGKDQFRQVMELQVGSANSEDDPKIMRVNQQGQWMGQRAFVRIPGDTVIPGPIKFQVDMLGNITATSFKTAASGERIRIIGDHLESYDTAGVKRIDLFQDRIDFFNFAGVAVGDIRGSAAGTALVLQGLDRLSLNTGTGFTKLGLDDASNTVFSSVMFNFFDVINLAQFPNPDPPTNNGAMYYNTTTNTFRACDSTGWHDIVLI